MKRTILFALMSAGSASAFAGSCAYPLPANLPPGTYEVRLFGDDTYNKYLASAGTFTVGQGASLGQPAVPGGPLTVNWTVVTSDDRAWLEIARPGAPTTSNAWGVDIFGWAYVNRNDYPANYCPPTQDGIINTNPATGLPTRMMFLGDTLEFRWTNGTLEAARLNVCPWRVINATAQELKDPARVEAIVNDLAC